VPKVKPERDPAPKPKAKKAGGKPGKDANGARAPGRHPLARRRALAAAALGVAALLMLGSGAVWRVVAPLVMGRDRYLLAADGITMSAPPEWIVGDVRRQVVETSGLAGRLSILDPNFVATIEHAFALHPWVESVVRIEKKYPPAVFVEVKYRKPVAVIEAPAGEGVHLLPIDARGIHLPAEDVPMIRRTYLPRITGIVGQPPVGQPWEDPRVPGAVDLAVRLGDVWEPLDLSSIVPSARVVVEDSRRFYTYDLVHRGGTRIEWGPAPSTAPPTEDQFEAKLGRLQQCETQFAPIDWVDWPEKINIRRGIDVKMREAKKRKPGADEPVVATNPPVVAAKPDDADDDAEPVVK
jgi:hypothetical protein